MILPAPLQQLRDLDKSSPQFHEQLNNALHRREYRTCVPTLQGEDLVWLVEYLDSYPRDTTEIVYTYRLSLEYWLAIRFWECVPRILRWVEEHQNIVPLLGITINPFQFISDWMSCGDLMTYITNHPDTNRLDLLSDVAEGLNHVHSFNVIHGDLKGPNVLVDATGRARIADFGLAMVTQSQDFIGSTSDEHDHGVRWIAPEILDYCGTHSKEGDVFSFAMVTIEAFTGAVPFNDDPPRAVMLAIVDGERPPRPTHPTFTDDLWALTQRCWDQEAHLRPQMSEVLQNLRRFGPPMWERLISRPLITRERISLITSIFSDSNESEAVQRLRGGDAQAFIDVMYKALDLPGLPPELRKKCFSTLRRTCGRHTLLPSSFLIPLCYDQSDTPLCKAGYADMWMGQHQGRSAAVKVLRAYSSSSFDTITSKYCREVVTWKALSHPNVLSLSGVIMKNDQFALVSEWMPNGDINQFVKTHRAVNRLELLLEASRGLVYLHAQAMIHGDLKGANILIDRTGHARLADFGLSTLISDPANPTASSSFAKGGMTRWMGPELLDPDQFGLKDSRPTKASDCYSLAMVILEVLSGVAPFASCKDVVVPRRVTKGERPARPQGEEGAWFTDRLWQMVQLCWMHQPEQRPTVKSVVEVLELVPKQSPQTGDDAETSSHDESHSTPSDISPATSPLLDKNTDLVKDTVHLVLPIPGSIDGDSGTNEGGALLPLLSPRSDPDLDAILPDPPIILDPHTQAWQRLISRDVPQDELASHIETIVLNVKAIGIADCLQGNDTQACIDAMDEALDSAGLGPCIRKKCVKLLSKMCAANALLPRSLQIELCYDPASIPHCRGGFADVWRGECRGREAAVKVLRVYVKSDLPKMTRRFCKEFVAWKALRHPNVLPLLGVVMSKTLFAMASEWMVHGNIVQFVTTHQGANQFELLADVARGLIYMHDQGMIHGDLKGANILIDENRRVRLADFGLLTILSDSTTCSSVQPCGTVRWMGPEIFDPEKFGFKHSHRSESSDCYALGMVVYEVLSGHVPFYRYAHYVVPGKVVEGKRPRRPEGVEGVSFTDDLWKVLEDCWIPQPSDRPRIKDVLQCLEKVSGSWTPPPRMPAASRSSSGVIAGQSVHFGEESSTSQVVPSQPC
ncbi:kinase-like protein [Thelephora ganbajun]|uniref:Kinase-like protein n=1 Tax=Thelephora ganbajun TaxID=370292 RepID=A0ACB6ZP48_THEGA|nr:kinase-like protein [Thelephora ganbajun]